MSQKDVEALHTVYEEWGRGNFRPRFDIYDRDMEWGWSEEFPDLGESLGTPSRGASG